MRPPLPDSTIDAFHRGRFWLVQPAKGGHRAGMDAMILAAAVPGGFSGALADFGAGAGAAGLAVASRCPEATVALVENAAEMAAFARLTLEHPDNASLAARCRLIEADVTLTGKRRAEAGLPDNGFDFVIMNPPFNSARDRATPNRLKQAAHVMSEGLLEAWVRSAAAVVRPNGGFAAIIRPDNLPDLLTALTRRFGAARIKPIHPRAGEPAIRVVVRAVRGSRAQLSLEPPLVLHETGSDRFSPEADAFINGNAHLFS